jgi:NodT family efflux transporter outer membrane factor (OMF) lipoprotein
MKNQHNYMPVLGALLFLQVITACKVSKDIAKQDMGLPANYARHTADTTNIGTLPWNTFFSEPVLKSMIAAAIAHNNDLQIALKDIEAADLTFRQAKLGNIPSVGIQVSANTSRPSDNSLNGLSLNAFNYSSKHIEDYNASAYLSWEADLWGKIKSQKAAALADFLKTAEAKKAIQTRIVSDVAKGYYDLLMLDTQLAIAKRNVELNDSTLTIIKLQFDAGEVTSLAVQQATAQELSAKELIPKFEQAITVQEDALSILTGVLPQQIARAGTLSAVVFSGNFDPGIPADLLSHRPDVRAAQLDVDEENGKVGYTKAYMYPSLTVTAQGGLDAIKASNWFNIPASLFGVVTGSILQPIFQQKKLRTAWEVEKVRRDQAVLRFRQSVLTAVGEVSDNLTRIVKLQQQSTLSAERVKTLHVATSNSQQLFSNGMADYLEVISAQGNALQAELDMATVQKAVLDAKVDLYRAVGGGWQ